MQGEETKEFIVNIPAYEVTVHAANEAEAYEMAMQEIHYDDMRITIVG